MVKSYLVIGALVLVPIISTAADVIVEGEDTVLMIKENSIKTIVFNKDRHLRTSSSVTFNKKDDLKDEGKIVRAVGRHTVIDCKNKSFYVLEIISIADDATMINRYKATKETWDKPIPGTMGDHEIKAVCAKDTIEV